MAEKLSEAQRFRIAIQGMLLKGGIKQEELTQVIEIFPNAIEIFAEVLEIKQETFLTLLKHEGIVPISVPRLAIVCQQLIASREVYS